MRPEIRRFHTFPLTVMKLYKRNIAVLLACTVFAILAPSCQNAARPITTAKRNENATRPFTHTNFINSPDYRFTRDMWSNDDRLAAANGKNSRVDILVGVQRGRLYVNDEIALDFPACTGKAGHETPLGSFRIQEKDRDHHSSSYGYVVDHKDDTVNADATPSSKIPPGGRYIPASMPYWMRINGPVGLHEGAVYRDSNSHGCVRIPVEACKILFNKLTVGSRVNVLP